MATALGASIVHTDDFASWEEPLDWWLRVLEQVLLPLAEGNAARYQRYDWTRHQLGEWVDLDSGAFVVLEGVSALRTQWVAVCRAGRNKLHPIGSHYGGGGARCSPNWRCGR